MACLLNATVMVCVDRGGTVVFSEFPARSSNISTAFVLFSIVKRMSPSAGGFDSLSNCVLTVVSDTIIGKLVGSVKPRLLNRAFNDNERHKNSTGSRLLTRKHDGLIMSNIPMLKKPNSQQGKK